MEWHSFLSTPIAYLKGVGEQRASIFKNQLGIATFGDLLWHFPFRYQDKTQILPIAQLQNGSEWVQIKGKIIKIDEQGQGAKKRLVAQIQDETAIMDLLWFNGITYLKKQLKVGQNWVVCGKVNEFMGKFSMMHPELENPEEAQRENALISPVYPATERISSKVILRLQKELLAKLEPIFFPAFFSDKERLLMDLLTRKQAFWEVHFPSDLQNMEKARKTLKLEELLVIQTLMLQRKAQTTKQLQSYVFEKIGNLFLDFYQKHLPFELTGAQKRVVKEIRRDVQSGSHLNRLVQGDVGSGKTIVALLSMLMALDNGFQATMMAPTEILAQQHFHGISELVKDLPIRVELLTGNIKGKKRTAILEDLKAHKIHILIGTHALIEDWVVFDNLGFAVIDEQHRFGVKQRAALWKKNALPPHVLVMTATPIPRTLAMTLYGDLDVSVIDELPPGRKAIETKHLRESERLAVLGFMEKEIQKGRQVYVVYPLIEENEKLDYLNLMEGYNSLIRRFPRPQYQIAIVHGQMKADAKEAEMQQFISGKAQILVATTVIEVGVNVPNASLMIIENAERFGLSQLHQLRGRVGRGAEQSYCLLMSKDKLHSVAYTRLKTMTETQDGFRIAEVDLRLRGAGDLMGTQQSGVLDLKIANLVQDANLLEIARNLAEQILSQDLGLAERRELALAVQKMRQEKPNWGRIS